MHVFCVGMYRSGSTWQYQVASNLVERFRAGRRLGFVCGESFAPQDAHAAKESSWASLKAHEGHPAFATALARGEALALYSYRDLRDVTFSLMRRLNASFEDIVERHLMVHTCLENDRYWRAQPRVLCQQYEQIVAEPVTAVIQIAAHLEVSLSRKDGEEIAALHSFQANRERTDKFTSQLLAKGMDLAAPENLYAHDPESLLLWNHVHQGEVGCWRGCATSAQLARLVQLTGNWLIAQGYEPQESWAIPTIACLSRELDSLRHQVAICHQELARELETLAEKELEIHQLRDQLASVQSFLKDTWARLHFLEQLGPVALSMARALHFLALRFPRLPRTLKRFLGWDPVGDTCAIGRRWASAAGAQATK
ncbi:hypothetical protein AYO44_13560 [Planctomycetaceae bacterium SCGC AG-212-F19]|nr:hypothetical protein AYO44_13560 [Planctomycetaceae bacterium SCGC AG-212-F19]